MVQWFTMCIIVVQWFTVKRKVEPLVLYTIGSLVYNVWRGEYMATDKHRYTVSVDEEMFQQIEDFRFEQRYQTRSQATVELIRLGLESLRKEAESNL